MKSPNQAFNESNPIQTHDKWPAPQSTFIHFDISSCDVHVGLSLASCSEDIHGYLQSEHIHVLAYFSAYAGGGLLTTRYFVVSI